MGSLPCDYGSKRSRGDLIRSIFHVFHVKSGILAGVSGGFWGDLGDLEGSGGIWGIWGDLGDLDDDGMMGGTELIPSELTPVGMRIGSGHPAADTSQRIGHELEGIGGRAPWGPTGTKYSPRFLVIAGVCVIVVASLVFKEASLE